MTDNERKLIDVFRGALASAEDDGAIRAAEYRMFPGWDSIAHMQLIADIEAAFDVMLDTDQVIDMSSFAKAKSILLSHGVDAG